MQKHPTLLRSRPKSVPIRRYVSVCVVALLQVCVSAAQVSPASPTDRSSAAIFDSDKIDSLSNDLQLFIRSGQYEQFMPVIPCHARTSPAMLRAVAASISPGPLPGADVLALTFVSRLEHRFRRSRRYTACFTRCNHALVLDLPSPSPSPSPARCAHRCPRRAAHRLWTDGAALLAPAPARAARRGSSGCA